MTLIPEREELPSEAEKSSILSIVNVSEIKKSKLEKPKEEDSYWYNKAWAWILFGSFIGLIFVILALINVKFLILIPLGPVIGFLSWYIRRVVRSYDDKTKGFFRRS
ncbi:hypothetical protein A2865_01525 [Candidatus Woesebacteria bacterium RIFCSPHIGHO2_01_FULL_39_17]|uniref:Uncharacterized protein n=3 Tax=Candidatus Woeseibacteriota TaxID=1752722 RepID=A0A0G0RIQ1_9BACT|nr:MAG: hypothetical protein US72_C0014G0032 [Microgenomates group bacterium GW2011_GWC1_38_12]KKQ93575.1 MAG: hypothetical protein UT19_C0010G0019 [Candidatus Woesebacteria bacterium GW2011_GWB1_39_10b]KKR13522.1 MAG: hypothetical protein UT40_C0015G0019 [Candidatus Woesebacteria bacterium GW2011_GWA1_39_21b]OGM22877.1 MAG: hypothetical protein A2865_01525 [Candidatus Woesebacteria bacterium RIFCSPHIGHO2_01_FULL_39_17]OGM61930.1 MAG: hypothetical protein A3A52_00095 [Candidatus Woesebacteria b